MKQFIDKLISRLEELRNRYQTLYCYGSDSVDYGKVIGLNDAISIINKLAKEYNNGWIPCEVRLPDNADLEYFLIWCR